MTFYKGLLEIPAMHEGVVKTLSIDCAALVKAGEDSVLEEALGEEAMGVIDGLRSEGVRMIHTHTYPGFNAHDGMRTAAIVIPIVQDTIFVSLNDVQWIRAQLWAQKKAAVDQLMASIFVHEATHLHQMRQGDLSYTAEGLPCWKGDVWSVERMRVTPYADQPWEAEAYTVQAKYLSKDDPVSFERKLKGLRAMSDHPNP